MFQGLHNIASSFNLHFLGGEIHDYDVMGFLRFGGFGILMVGIGLYGISRIAKSKLGQEVLNLIKQKFRI